MVLVLFVFSDKLCPLRWNNHHPGAEAAVPGHRRERIEHLPVSNQQLQKVQCCMLKEKTVVYEVK